MPLTTQLPPPGWLSQEDEYKAWQAATRKIKRWQRIEAAATALCAAFGPAWVQADGSSALRELLIALDEKV